MTWQGGWARGAALRWETAKEARLRRLRWSWMWGCWQRRRWLGLVGAAAAHLSLLTCLSRLPHLLRLPQLSVQERWRKNVAAREQGPLRWPLAVQHLHLHLQHPLL